MYEKALKDDLDIVVSDVYWDYNNGLKKYKKDLEIKDEIISSEKYIDLFFKGKVFPAVWNKMYKLNLYKDNGINYPERISMGEDLLTTILLASKASRIGKVDKAYIHYTQNINSAMNSNPAKKIYELIQVFEMLEKKIPSITKEKINQKKRIDLGILISDLNYNLNDKFYKEALLYYIELFKGNYNIKCSSKKYSIYFKILKKFPSVKILKLICKFNRIGSRLLLRSFKK